MPLEPIVPPALPQPPAMSAAGLRALARRAQAGDAHARAGVREAAQMLEAHFVTWLLREMRRTIPEGGLLPRGPAQETYDQLLDDALGQAVARRGGIGLARAIEAQLAPRALGAAAAPSRPPDTPTTPTR